MGQAMLKSMTGFGRAEEQNEKNLFTVEIKSVNHRYCEISIRLPKKLNFFEVSIRNLVKQYINRGKVDIFINYEDYTVGKCQVKYNKELAEDYYQHLLKMSEDFFIDNDIRVGSLARFPEVLTLEEQTVDENEIWESLEKTVRIACEKFVETRINEGAHLKEDICTKLDYILELVAKIELRSPDIIKEYRQKLMDKVNELLGDRKIDETLLATEITIFADKICVDEETVRLKAHINSMRDTLNEGVNIGRKLDFIAQEMNREANTILSKANDFEVSQMAIGLKTEIEKIREQIQNIE